MQNTFKKTNFFSILRVFFIYDDLVSYLFKIYFQKSINFEVNCQLYNIFY